MRAFRGFVTGDFGLGSFSFHVLPAVFENPVVGAKTPGSP